jgi:hypothetical protein
MEDKELQQLFDAKRWQEENQRQQEAIAAATAGHRRWLGWTIAAAVMVGLLGLTPLLRSEEKEPMLVAEAGEVIEAIDTIEAIETIETTETIEAIENIGTIENIKPIGTIDTIKIIETIEPIPPTPAGPRIHRRRGTLLAETARQPERPKVSPLIAHYLDIPDSINFTSNIVIPLKK